jgi:hypothetical protein
LPALEAVPLQTRVARGVEVLPGRGELTVVALAVLEAPARGLVDPDVGGWARIRRNGVVGFSVGGCGRAGGDSGEGCGGADGGEEAADRSIHGFLRMVGSSEGTVPGVADSRAFREEA